ncbi:MAG: trigger factor [Planctomycetota bacterium]|nr:trigger factor [Planctomycetota bacterium]
MSKDHAHSHPGLSVDVERTDATSVKVSFSVTAEEFEQTVRRALTNVGRHTKVKGFRPGKVPIQMLEKRHGAEVRREVLHHFLDDAYRRAVEDNELKPAAHPHIDIESIDVSPGQGVSHEFELFLKPDFELGNYKGLEVAGRTIEVGEEEVEAALEDLRRQRSRTEPAGDEGLPEDGMAVCKIEFLGESSDEPLLSRDGIRLSPKTAPTGVDADAFREAMTGAKEGDVVTVPVLAFPDEFPQEEARGQPGTCRLTLDQAFRIVMPAEEELFEIFEAEDAAGMRRAAAERIREGKQEAEEQRIEAALLNQVIELHPMEVPGGYIEQQVQAKAEETRRELLSAGTSEEDADARIRDELERMRDSTAKALKAAWLIEEIAGKEGLEVQEKDMAGELKRIAERNQVPVDEVRKYYQAQGLVSQLALELLERRVRSFLREAADIRVTD